MNDSPSFYGVPHKEWRPGQLETVKWIVNTPGVLIVQAPTGSGKSATASALGKFGTVRTLTHTINLQQQYKEYDFEPMYGMSHYECELFYGDGLTAEDCLYPEAMFKCPAKDACSYLIRRNEVRASRKQSLSYAYFLNAHWPSEAVTKYIYLDEAHLLRGMVRDYCTVKYNRNQLHYDDLPLFPQVELRNNTARVIMAANWLEEIRVFKTNEYSKLQDTPHYARPVQLRRKMRRLAREIRTLGQTIRWSTEFPGDFYCNWDREEFKLMPLTSRLYFNDLFVNKFSHKVILTSATIGNPDTFARELGLKFWKSRDVPSAFPPEAMPVHAYSDAPALSHSTTQLGWRKWADVIRRIVNGCNPKWSGIIHVSSRSQAFSLANALSRDRKLQDRVYVPEGKSTGEKIQSWQNRKKKVPNTLAIAYSFHMGLDAYDDEINIIGKVPFATLDEFGKALLNYDPIIYQHDAAVLTEQASGRIRRGRPEHYEESGEPTRKFVAIADNNYIRITDQFSDHFNSCIYQN
jgi:Rad3-related DNA helicase